MTERLLDTLDRLIAFNTVSDQPNADMIDHIAAICAGYGGTCTRIPGKDAGKVGLVARFGPDVPGGIVLSGHCDVVPTAGQTWTRPDFRLTRDGDRLFGRGTTDMKGFLACMLDVARLSAGVALARPLTLVFSYDEEVGCVGIQDMRPALAKLLGQPRLCIIGEPTEMRVAVGHKGKASYRANFTGLAGHSALAPHFVNALHMASDFITQLRDLQTWYARDGAQDAAYDVPHTTLHAGILTGGTALNIVPDTAELTFEYRYLAADGSDAVFDRIQQAAQAVTTSYRAACDRADVSLTQFTAYPGLDAPGEDTVRFATALAGSPETTKVAFGTEAGVFAGLGLPAVVCGPGSMQGQGHKPDEYIELSQLVACSAMLARALDYLSEAPSQQGTHP